MAFRFFYLQKEPSNFLRVANIIDHRVSLDVVSRHLRGLKEQWHGAMARRGLNVKVNDEELTAGLLIDLWFNAHYFHSDAGKEERIRQINAILSTDLHRVFLADAVFEATKAVLSLYNSVKEMRV